MRLAETSEWEGVSSFWASVSLSALGVSGWSGAAHRGLLAICLLYPRGGIRYIASCEVKISYQLLCNLSRTPLRPSGFVITTIAPIPYSDTLAYSICKSKPMYHLLINNILI